jgi:hypothetical protein
MEGVIPGVKLAHLDVPPAQTSRQISVWPGHTYEFELVAATPSGLRWSTPTYQVRMPRDDEITAIVRAAEPAPPQFIRLAPPRVVEVPDNEPIRYLEEVSVQNADFEDGLHGWTPSGSELHAPDVGLKGDGQLKRFGINARWGDRIAGFTHRAGEQREQVFAESTLSQQIATKPGHSYLLAAMVHTSVTNGPRGDTRVRLFADPRGGQDDRHPHSTQWYWTDGQWKRFTHRWRAESEQATIGVGFFRWRDLDRASAYVDHVHVYDLGPSPASSGDPPDLGKDRAGFVLVDAKTEADERVEGYLEAPPGYVITGLGARAHADNITTFWLRVQPLLPDGTLGTPEHLRGGWEPDCHLEAHIELPDGYVATGFGAGIAPEWDVKRLGVWARPLQPNGTLGDEKLFRGGIDLESGFEKAVRLPEGRVLTAAGLNCGFNDVNRIRARSAMLIPTSAYRATAVKIEPQSR